MDLGKSGLLSWVSLVGSDILGFKEENPPSDPPKSVFGGRDPSLTVTSVGSAWVIWKGGSIFRFLWIPLGRIRGVHRLVRVGFMPNPRPTR